MSTPHVLIVGGTAGLGRVLARRFSQRQFTVSVLGRHASPEVEERLPGVHLCACDLADLPATTAAVSESIARHGKLRNLVFCQRYRGKDDPWAGEMQVSLNATKAIIELCADQFDGAVGDSAIVIVSSAANRFVLAEQPVGYHVAKAALIQMARYYAVVLAEKGIRVNAVSPDMYIKEESRKAYAEKPELRQIRKLYDQIIPLGRMCTAEDVADAVEFLSSGQSSFITGQEIVVDGGLSLAGQAAVARRAAGLAGTKITR